MKGRVGRRPNRQTALVPTTSLSKVAASKAMETVEKEEDEKFQTVVLSLIASHSRCSWLTWIVVKIILKVTTYTVLKADKMDAEAHTWITDWGPFVNPVISLAQLVIKPTVWTLEILGLSEPLTALGWQIYKDSVFYGLFSDHPVEDLVERSWISYQFSAVWTSFLRFGAENSLVIPAAWILWLVALDFFRWKDRSKQRKVLRSLSKEGNTEKDSKKELLKSITVEEKSVAKRENLGNMSRRYRPRRGADLSNQSKPKLAIEGPVTEKEDEDAFSVTEFFKDMCTIWTCLVNQSNSETKKKGIHTTNDERPKKPCNEQLPLPAIENKTTKTLNKNENEAENVITENSESEDWSETSSSGGEAGLKDTEEEVVDLDYQSMIYLPENQLKQIGKALAAVHCWYCKKRRPEKLAKCRGCRKARYCSEECHSKDWKNHKHHCNKKRSSKRAATPTSDSVSSEVD